MQIARQIRALNPWPRAYTYADGQRLLLLNAQPAAAAELPHTNAPPGTIIAISSAGPVVQTGAGLLLVTELQPAGRRAMSGQDFVRGQGGLIGQHWHEEGK
jgi:methionyl-tRNA formyltransferase